MRYSVVAVDDLVLIDIIICVDEACDNEPNELRDDDDNQETSYDYNPRLESERK